MPLPPAFYDARWQALDAFEREHGEELTTHQGRDGAWVPCRWRLLTQKAKALTTAMRKTAQGA